jgi:ribosomal protein L37E
MRAPLSVALPAACGTTSFMARSGYCACAGVAKAAVHVRPANKSCSMRIGFPFAFA